VSRANAALTPRARLRLAWLVVEQGWPVARAAERYDVSCGSSRSADRQAGSADAQVVDGAAGPVAGGVQHQLERRVIEDEVGVAEPQLGRRRPNSRE
jgi:hypothetical protein